MCMLTIKYLLVSIISNLKNNIVSLSTLFIITTLHTTSIARTGSIYTYYSLAECQLLYIITYICTV